MGTESAGRVSTICKRDVDFLGLRMVPSRVGLNRRYTQLLCWRVCDYECVRDHLGRNGVLDSPFRRIALGTRVDAYGLAIHVVAAQSQPLGQGGVVAILRATSGLSQKQVTW